MGQSLTGVGIDPHRRRGMINRAKTNLSPHSDGSQGDFWSQTELQPNYSGGPGQSAVRAQQSLLLKKFIGP